MPVRSRRRKKPEYVYIDDDVDASPVAAAASSSSSSSSPKRSSVKKRSSPSRKSKSPTKRPTGAAASDATPWLTTQDKINVVFIVLAVLAAVAYYHSSSSPLADARHRRAASSPSSQVASVTTPTQAHHTSLPDFAQQVSALASWRLHDDHDRIELEHRYERQVAEWSALLDSGGWQQSDGVDETVPDGASSGDNGDSAAVPSSLPSSMPVLAQAKALIDDWQRGADKIERVRTLAAVVRSHEDDARAKLREYRSANDRINESREHCVAQSHALLDVEQHAQRHLELITSNQQRQLELTSNFTRLIDTDDTASARNDVKDGAISAERVAKTSLADTASRRAALLTSIGETKRALLDVGHQLQLVQRSYASAVADAKQLSTESDEIESQASAAAQRVATARADVDALDRRRAQVVATLERLTLWSSIDEHIGSVASHAGASTPSIEAAAVAATDGADAAASDEWQDEELTKALSRLQRQHERKLQAIQALAPDHDDGSSDDAGGVNDGGGGSGDKVSNADVQLRVKASLADIEARAVVLRAALATATADAERTSELLRDVTARRTAVALKISAHDSDSDVTTALYRERDRLDAQRERQDAKLVELDAHRVSLQSSLEDARALLQTSLLAQQREERVKQDYRSSVTATVAEHAQLLHRADDMMRQYQPQVDALVQQRNAIVAEQRHQDARVSELEHVVAELQQLYTELRRLMASLPNQHEH